MSCCFRSHTTALLNRCKCHVVSSHTTNVFFKISANVMLLRAIYNRNFKLVQASCCYRSHQNCIAKLVQISCCYKSRLPVYLFSVYLKTLSINWSQMVGQLMNWIEFGRKRYWPSRETLSTTGRMNLGKPAYISVSIFTDVACIPTRLPPKNKT